MSNRSGAIPHRSIRRNASRRRGRSARLLAASNRRLRLEPLEDRRLLATFTVTDLSLDSGPGSLRQAILDANAGGDPVDDIVFADGLTGTVTLTSGEIPITSSLNITGPGAEAISVSGNNNSRIFNIDDANGGNLLDIVIDGLTLTDGSATGAGGAIVSQENLTLRNSVVSGSAVMGSGGAIAASLGTTTIESSTLDGNTATGATAQGGAIVSDAEVIVTNSTISNNTVTGVTDGTNSIDIRGGAISGGGNVTITASTINDNKVRFEQQSTTGSVALRGGAISGAGDQVAISSSTIRNNSAYMQAFYSQIESVASAQVHGGGIQMDTGNITITKSTIEDNGASIEFFNVTSGAASLEGAGIRSASGDISVVDSEVRTNRLRISRVSSDIGISVEGGGIRNASGPVTVTDSLITGNRAAVSQATTTATLRVEGGGIRNGANISIQRSEVSENYIFEGYGAVTGTTEVEGGGVWGNTSVVAIDNATISGNRMRANNSLGAGVHLNSSPGTLTINSSTISGNITKGSGAGISHQGGTLSIAYSTIAFNQADYDGTVGGQDGGGILVGAGGGTPLLQHTIVAGNTVDTASDDVSGSFDAASRFNLIGNGDGSVGLTNGVNGNQVGAAGTEIDPLLGPLVNNGGPTETHSLLAGSPALDAGDPAFAGPPSSDQRLAPFARVADGGTASRIDIGAYERQTVSLGPPVVTTADDELDAGFDANDLSLREAISIANGSIGADTITFDTAGVFSTPQTIALVATLGEMPVSDAVTITGPGADVVTIDAQGNSRIFNIGDANRSTLLDVEIDGLTLTRGNVPRYSSPSGGGAIVTFENLTLRNSALTSNTAFSGGALLALTEAFENGSTARITIQDSVFSGNVARDSSGGAISINEDAVGENSTSTTLISNVVLSGNTANRDGGAIYLRVDNSGPNTTVTKTLRNVTITGNTAGGAGGGISDDSDTASATGTGTNTLTIEDSDITGNMADNDGGGIDLDMAPGNPGNEFAVNITRVNISGNTAGADASPNDSNGGDGGGISNSNDADESDTTNTVTITDSTISGNTALRGSFTFQGRGGGVYSATTADDVNSVESVIIRNTAIFNNIAATSGGGVYLDADPSTVEPTATNSTTITDSTINNNTAAVSGGGVYSVMNASGSVMITNTTISGNNTNGADAPGGGIYNLNKSGGSLAINSSTLTNNSSGGNGVGGGLYNLNDGVDGAGASGLTTLNNTILAGNVAGGGSDPDVATTSSAGGATSIDARFSIIGDIGGATVNDLGGNQIGSFGALVDPLLAPLANNGGPTLTHELLPGSPAIDAGDPAVTFDPSKFDQRGAPFVRVVDGGTAARTDIGAYEVQTLGFLVDTAVDENDGDFSVGDLSLREAILLANANPGADTIGFDATLSGSTITLTGGELSITQDVTIVGLGADQLTVSGNSASRIFNITDSDNMNLLDVEIRGLTLRDGVTSGIGDVGRGGAVFAQENLTILDSVFTGNTASQTGGALFVDASAKMVGAASVLTIQRSQFTLNQSTGDGGAIDVESDADADGSSVTVRIEDTTISGNSASGTTGDGGGLYLDVESYADGGTGTVEATLLRTTITGNTAGDKGGGLGTDMDINFTAGGTTTLTILDSDISGNLAANGGGGVYLENAGFGLGSFASTIIRRTTITGNTTTEGNGGGIIDYNSQPGNSAKTTILLDEVVLSGNSATLGRGGGFFTDANTFSPDAEVTITIQGSTITGNNAQSGGGIENTIYASAGATNANLAMAIRDSTVSGNTAGTGGGGGLDINPDSYEPSATVATIIENSTISGNSTEGRGGGILNTGSGVTTVTASTITGNTSGVGSGDPVNSGGGIHVDGGTFSLQSTIVAANTDNTGTALDIDDTTTAITANFSLIGDNTGSSLSEAPVGSADANGNLVGGATGGVINPLLGPLANNGGPTFTHALLSGSPAIDMGGGTPIAGLLFNTGVDSQGNLLGDSVDDPHYTIFSQPAGGSLTDQTVPANGFPIPPWLPNEVDSRWIGPATNDAQGPAGEYVYRTTFDLSGLDFANWEFQITGRWASDNNGTDILINGVSTGQTNGQFTAFSSFAVSAGFVPGLNTLDFVVQNSLGIESPVGLIVDDIQLIANRVYDQRGFAFARVVGGRVDIGAVESSAVSADFDLDGDVDGSDFLTWQRGFGTTPDALHSQGDADVDGTVAAADLAIWQLQYGMTAPAESASVLGELAAHAIDEGSGSDAATPHILSVQPQPLVATVGEQSSAISSHTAEPTRADVIDAAFALAIKNANPAETAGVPDEPFGLEADVVALGTSNDSSAPSSELDDSVTVRPTESATENQDQPWLEEVLLEQVFG